MKVDEGEKYIANAPHTTWNTYAAQQRFKSPAQD